jgi:hypothetical protein
MPSSGQAASPEVDASPALASTASVSVEATRENVEDARSDLKAVLADSAGQGAQGPAADAGPSDDESYRALIAADIRTAYGREATDQDYAYWLGKLEGPNDSGFVTSGKMTATEYWHRRMLGWQAGGADVATSGPYAGGGGPHGDVPAATDVVPSVPPGGVYNEASAERISELRFVIDSDIRTAYGRSATDEDYGYWLNKFLGENDSSLVTSGRMSSDEYWHRRLLGWQAGGADVATRGPFAGSGDDRGRPVLPVDRLFETFRSGQAAQVRGLEPGGASRPSGG